MQLKNWTIHRLVLIGFAAVAVTFALLGGAAWHGMTRSVALSKQIEHGSEILRAIENINAALMDMAAANRFYMIKPSAELLDRRDKAVDTLRTAIVRANGMMKDDPRQQALMQRLNGIYAERIQLVDYYTALRMQEGIAGVLKNYGKTEPVDSRFQETLQQLRLHELELLQLHQNEVEARMRSAQERAVLLLGMLAAFLVAIYWLIHRNIKRDETRAALEKSEALLRQILDLLPVGVFVADQHGKLTLINPAAHELWGTSDQLDAGHYNYPAWRLASGKKVRADEYGIVRAFRDGEISRNEEFEIRRVDGERRIIRNSAIPLRDKHTRIIGAITVNMDVTDLKQAEQGLKAAHDALEARVAMRTRELVAANEQLRTQIEERRRIEQELRHMQSTLTNAQRIAHIGSWERDLLTDEVRWSDEIFRICGLRPAEALPTMRLLFDIIHAEDRESVHTAITAALESGTNYKMTYRIVRSDGIVRHVLSQADIVTSPEGKPLRMIGSLLDITEQVLTEESLRQLAAHQEQVKEEERKRIAREIHDEMGQNLMVLRIDVSMLCARTADTHPKLHAKAEMMLATIDNTIKSLRAIINNLRPVVLDLGLYAAIRWQLNEFQRRGNIECELLAAQDDLDRGLNEAQTVALFRVLQESLTNVARHANAHNVYISLQREDGFLTMRISDDGVGIYPNDRRKPKTFGLLGMRERIAALGGSLTLDSTVGQGTVLTLTIPLQAAEQADMNASQHLQA
ncbi:MAG: PAS domain S-box protein [Burkholderiales bacterium]|nr:PAS domain S-box protein [Burkholderiales bacterium]